jgi:hypothetical protein
VAVPHTKAVEQQAALSSAKVVKVQQQLMVRLAEVTP